MNSCGTRFRYIAVRPEDNQYDISYHAENENDYLLNALKEGSDWLRFYLHKNTVEGARLHTYPTNNQIGYDKTTILFFDSIYYFN